MRICDKIAVALIVFTATNAETVFADTETFQVINSQAIVLPSIGRTYEIAERDALAEVRAYAAKADSKSVKARLRERILNYRPYIPESKRGNKPTRATEDRVFLVDMTWTLDFDIPNGRGGILYPRGYTFNPLNFVTYDPEKKIVVIDGTDPEQVEWLKDSEFVTDTRAKILLSDGVYGDVGKAIKRHCFYLDWRMRERFRLERVPSIIRKFDDDHMMVREIGIKSGN